MAGSSAVKTIKFLIESAVKTGGFDRHLSRVNITGGGNGTLTGIMKVENQDCNSGGTLHGGMTALLVDSLSGVALMTHPKCTSSGVSLSINMTYMSAAPLGDEIVIKASTDKIGKRMAFLNVEIFNRKNGAMVAKGTQVKFIGDPSANKF